MTNGDQSQFNSGFRTPVLFIIFERPEVTKQVFEQIRLARPRRLYVAADGPAEGDAAQALRCDETRNLIKVDWPCELHRLYRDSNKGCREGVMDALDWFFDAETEGIILEDDCIPSKTFWPFCEELLSRYRDDLRVASISGSNYELGLKNRTESYYFSRQVHIWGWATWRRTWRAVDREMRTWPEMRNKHMLETLFHSRGVGNFWEERFDKAMKGDVNVWSYYLLESIWANGQVCINPSRNLISNVGFGNLATHTRRKSLYENMPVQEFGFPLVHPKLLMVDEESDSYVGSHMYTSRSLPSKVLVRLAREVERAVRLNKNSVLTVV